MHADTGHNYTAYDFFAYGPFRTVEGFALEAARPAWPKVPDITRAELAEIVRRIRVADDDFDYYMLLLQTNVQHPRVADLMLADASPEAIVDAALSYRPNPL